MRKLRYREVECLARSCSRWVGCPRNLILAWRFAFRKCLRECFQSQHPGGREGSRIGQKGKCNWLWHGSVNTMGSCGVKMALHCFPELGWGTWTFPLHHASCPCKGVVTLDVSQVPSIEDFLESSLLVTLPRAGGINPSVLKGHLGGISQNLLYEWSWNSKLGCLASEFSFSAIRRQIILSTTDTLGWVVGNASGRLK